LRIPAAREDEDWCLRVVADVAEHLKAIEARKTEIEDDEIWPIGLKATECLRAVAGLGHDETLAPQHVCSEIEHVGIVFDEKQLDH
jgi:hypothetical protein